MSSSTEDPADKPTVQRAGSAADRLLAGATSGLRAARRWASKQTANGRAALRRLSARKGGRAVSGDGTAASGRARRRRRWSLTDPFSFSTIAARIAALNVVALGILVVGVLYLSQFRAGLIDLKIDSLKTEANLIAITIAESAGDPAGQRYDRILANEVLRRLSLPTGLRAQLYDRSGRLTGDTRSLFGGQIVVEVSRLPSPGLAEGVLARIEDLYDRVVSLLKPRPEIYRETPPAGISRDDEVYRALEGESASAQRLNSEEELILSVAAPVKRVKTVMGALVLSTEGGDIDQIVRQERVAILQVFLVAFIATVLVSIALAQTVAWPIRQLAQAAERGGGAAGGPLNPERIAIPDLSGRRDEVGHLSTALRRMTQALYSRIDAIETFAADVSHEIKNPLTSLRSAVETLRLAKDDAQRAKLLAVIEHDVRRLDRLVTDISNASRLDAELVREQRESFDLSKMLETIASAADCQGVRRAVRVIAEGVSTPRLLRGLEARLAQVFHNLLDNALSFSPDNAQIRLSASSAACDGRPAVLVQVVDEGPGVPEENLASIFERFYSERPQGEEFGRHSGLGLSICRQIVEAHGGRIWAENRTDRAGARFCVLIPV